MASQQLPPEQPEATPACIVCGNGRFEPGPNGRLSDNALPPQCCRCGSLERHRRLRLLYRQLPPEYLATLEVLQFSPDIGVDPSWFRAYEVSEFGGENSLDLEAIDRPDGSYDLLICNHVLEHVPDDRQGFRELLRVVAPEGLVQITVPSPFLRARTIDWGYPKAQAHDHYRGYGSDIASMFELAVPEAKVVRVTVMDPVTGSGDFIYLCTLSHDLAHKLQNWLPQGNLVTT